MICLYNLFKKIIISFLFCLLISFNSYGYAVDEPIAVFAHSDDVRVLASSASWKLSEGPVAFPSGSLFISFGNTHQLTITDTGQLITEGSNSYGELGLGHVDESASSHIIFSDAIWNSTAAGDSTSFAIKSDNTLWSWGKNTDGQLGQGTNVDISVPQQLGIDSWLSVSAGNAHTLAINADNTLWTWGQNSQGQLGLSNTVNSNIPIQVGNASWLSVFAGSDFSFGIQTDGTLWAWGNNTTGIFGNSLVTSTTNPIQIGTDTWDKLAIGTNHIIALKLDGTVWAWGTNDKGQLGDGTINTSLTPILVDNQKANQTWKDIAAGNGFSLAIADGGNDANDALWAWGLRTDGLGYGNGPYSSYSKYEPVPIYLIENGLSFTVPYLNGHWNEATWPESRNNSPWAINTTNQRLISPSVDSDSESISYKGEFSNSALSFSIFNFGNSSKLSLSIDNENIFNRKTIFTNTSSHNLNSGKNICIKSGTHILTWTVTNADGFNFPAQIALSELDFSGSVENCIIFKYDGEDIIVGTNDIVPLYLNVGENSISSNDPRVEVIKTKFTAESFTGTEHTITFNDLPNTLSAGDYELTATDANGNAETITIRVVGTTTFNFDVKITDSLNVGDNTGRLGGDLRADITSSDNSCISYQDELVSHNEREGNVIVPLKVTQGCFYKVVLYFSSSFEESFSGWQVAVNNNDSIGENESYFITTDSSITEFEGTIGIGFADYLTEIKELVNESGIENARLTFTKGSLSLNYFSDIDGKTNIKLPRDLNYSYVVSHEGYKTTDNFSLDATNTNFNAPVITPPGTNQILLTKDYAPAFTIVKSDVNILEDEIYRYEIVVTDANNSDSTVPDPVSITILEKPDWLKFSGKTTEHCGSINMLCGTPTQEHVGNVYQITINAISGSENVKSSTQSYQITVLNTNDAPTFSISTLPNASEDSPYLVNLSAIAVDEDNEELTLSLETLHPWLTVSNNKLVGQPEGSHVGISDVELLISDGQLFSKQTFSIKVLAVNDKPVVTGESNLVAQEDILFEYIIPASDEEGNILTFTVVQKPNWLVLSGNTLSGTPDQNAVDLGPQQININISDGELSTSYLSTITVENSNDAPIFTSTPNTGGVVGSLYSYNIIYLDDDGDNVTLTVVDLPSWLSLDENSLQGTPIATGEYTVVLKISDTVGSTEQSFIITVEVNNAMPVFTSTPVNNAVEAEQYQYTLIATDLDQDTLTYNIVESPDWLSLSNNVLSGIPSDVDIGDHNIIITVTDNKETVEQKFTITVIDNGITELLLTAPDNITIEATGELTQVFLGNPIVQDDVDLNLLAIPDKLGPFNVGNHIILWTVVDRDKNLATAQQTVIVIDTKAPVFPDIQAIAISAKGFITDVINEVSLTAFDLVDGDISASLLSEAKLAPGKHELVWQAKDTQNNVSETTQQLSILPIAKLGGTYLIEKGSQLIIPVTLNGTAATYPVTLNVLTSGTTPADNYTLVSDIVIIESGQQGKIIINIDDNNFVVGTRIELILNEAENAILTDENRALIELTEENITPVVDVTVFQNDEKVNQIFKDKGPVTISLTINDVNINDRHSIVANRNEVVANPETSNIFEVSEQELQSLTNGKQNFIFTVTETNTNESYRVIEKLELNIFEQSPILSADSDSDNDGISDADEGFEDSDGDGIADFIDNNSDRSQLPYGEEGKHIQTSQGLSLSIGKSILSVTGVYTNKASLDLAGFKDKFDGELLNGFTPVIPVLDFVISGLTVKETTASVVIVLPSDIFLPEHAQYYKYDPVTGWTVFISDEFNTIKSANLNENGICPDIDDQTYQLGLIAGTSCIQLTLLDGGAYDADGVINSKIEDPGVIVANMPPEVSINSVSNKDEEATVLLTSTASDPEGEALIYFWSQISGPQVKLSNQETSELTVILPNVTSNEVVSFRLTVSDGVNSIEKEVSFGINWSVLPLNISLKISETTAYEGTLIKLDGTASSDPEGLAIEYLWIQLSGPEIEFKNSNSANASFLAPQVVKNSIAVIQLTIKGEGDRSKTKTVDFAITEIDIDKIREKPDGGSTSINYLLFIILICMMRIFISNTFHNRMKVK